MYICRYKLKPTVKHLKHFRRMVLTVVKSLLNNDQCQSHQG